MAKLEKARRFKDDYSVPKLGANEDQLGWQINNDEIIYYRNLSDLTVDTLNQLRISNFEKDNNNATI